MLLALTVLQTNITQTVTFSLENFLLKAGLIIVVLAVALGLFRFVQATHSKRKAFFNGFFAVLAIAIVLFFIFGGLAYLVGVLQV